MAAQINRDYSDIINMPHHRSKTHPPMSVLNRAAQFAPFAALTGYEDLIEDAGKKNGEKDDSVISTTDDIYLP